MGAGKTSGLLEKVFSAGGTIALGQLAKFVTDDNTVVVAAAATDAIIGVAMHAATSGQDVTVQLLGIADVKTEGTITRGDLVTSNANGNGVAAAPSAGTNNGVIGRAMQSGVTGDIIAVALNIGTTQG
jgi:hypothetical protein